MKKLLYAASALMAFALTACNNELPEEYRTPATVTNFTQSYKVFIDTGLGEVQDEIPADAPIVFGGTVNSKYGPVEALISYAVCTPEVQKALKLGRYDINKPSDDWQSYWLYTAKFSTPDIEDGTMQRMVAPVENAKFEITMPGQPAGTVVMVQLMVRTPYLRSFGGTTVYIVAGGDNDGGTEGEGEEGGKE